MKKYIFLISFFFAINLFAEEKKPFIQYSFATYENDSVYTRRDQYYSNGIQLMFFTRDTEKNSKKYNYSFGVGQKIYTPNDIEIPYFIPNDRPYAGYLYSFLNKNIYSDNKIDTFGLSIGLSGKKSFSEYTQKKIHSLIGSPEPEGWDNQIKGQMLFSVNYNKTISWLEPQENQYNFDIITKTGFNLGTPITNFVPSVEFRYGFNLQQDYISNTMNPFLSTISINNVKNSKSYFLFFELQPNFVIYNSFLDKHNLSRNNKLDIKKNWFCFNSSIGLNYRYKNYYAKHSITFLSKEFKEQKNNQLLFSIYLGYIF